MARLAANRSSLCEERTTTAFDYRHSSSLSKHSTARAKIACILRRPFLPLAPEEDVRQYNLSVQLVVGVIFNSPVGYMSSAMMPNDGRYSSYRHFLVISASTNSQDENPGCDKPAWCAPLPYSGNSWPT